MAQRQQKRFASCTVNIVRYARAIGHRRTFNVRLQRALDAAA